MVGEYISGIFNIRFSLWKSQLVQSFTWDEEEI